MSNLNRRQLISVVAGTAAAGAFLPSSNARAKPGARKLDLNDPRDQLYATMKMLGQLEDGKEVVNYASGTIWSIFKDGSEMEPLFNLSGVGFSRTWKESEESYKTTDNFIVCYTDLQTGEVLEKWYNPWLKEIVPVVNYASRIDTVSRASPSSSKSPDAKVRVKWQIDGDDVIRWTDAQVRKLNPITPEKWPKASAGKWYTKNQSNQMLARLAELQNPKTISVRSLSVGQRHGPWYPWMQMGQAPGRTYRRDVTRRVDDIGQIPQVTLTYARKHFPDFMQAPKEWTGVYIDPETLWTQQYPAEK